MSIASSVFLTYKRLLTIGYTVLLRSSFRSFDATSRIVPPFRFCGLKGVQIGARVMIHDHCWFQLEKAATLIVKDHAAIGMNATLSVAEYVEIGEYVLTGRNVFISDHNHEYHDISTPISLQGITPASKVTIGSGTWLGHNSVVLPGSSIGRNCVIGANSVVKGFVPDYSVAVGVPARVVKHFSKQAGAWTRNSE